MRRLTIAIIIALVLLIMLVCIRTKTLAKYVIERSILAAQISIESAQKNSINN